MGGMGTGRLKGWALQLARLKLGLQKATLHLPALRLNHRLEALARPSAPVAQLPAAGIPNSF